MAVLELMKKLTLDDRGRFWSVSVCRWALIKAEHLVCAASRHPPIINERASEVANRLHAAVADG